MEITTTTNGNILLARGLARSAARNARSLGGAYRHDCRAYPAITGLWRAYADAYDDERDALAEG